MITGAYIGFILFAIIALVATLSNPNNPYNWNNVIMTFIILVGLGAAIGYLL